MNTKKVTTFEEALYEFRKNPKFIKEERKVRPYYQMAEQIINRRSALNVTQKDLSKKAHTHQSRISKIESGEFDIRMSTLISVAEALDCHLHIQFCPNIDIVGADDHALSHVLFNDQTLILQPSTTFQNSDPSGSISIETPAFEIMGTN